MKNKDWWVAGKSGSKYKVSDFRRDRQSGGFNRVWSWLQVGRDVGIGVFCFVSLFLGFVSFFVKF